MRGLPPPTRGIPTSTALNRAGAGSTPAHAGNTELAIVEAIVCAVYPRPRGEYERGVGYPDGRRGLPPPTRGIRSGSA